MEKRKKLAWYTLVVGVAVITAVGIVTAGDYDAAVIGPLGVASLLVLVCAIASGSFGFSALAACVLLGVSWLLAAFLAAGWRSEDLIAVALIHFFVAACAIPIGGLTGLVRRRRRKAIEQLADKGDAAPAQLRMNLSYYFLPFLIGGVAAWPLSLIGAIGLLAEGPKGEVLNFALISVAPGLVASAALLVFLYRAWKALPAEFRRTSPGKAVGFLFIPFFNMYWVFQAFWGLARDLNSAARRLNGGVRVSEGVPLAACILMLVSAIPFVGLVTGMAVFILLLIFMWQLSWAVNSLRVGP